MKRTYYEFNGSDGGFRDPFGSFSESDDFGFGRKRHSKEDFKSHIYQGYKEVPPGKWKASSIEEIKKDFNLEPKFWNTPFYYVQMEDRDFIIRNQFPILIFFDHQNQQFLYIRGDGKVMPEDSCIESEEKARELIQKKVKDEEGKIKYVIWQDGSKYPYLGNQ